MTTNVIGNPNEGYSNSTALSLALTDLPGYMDFINLFDQYRITRIKATLVYNGGNVAINDTNPITNYQLPTVFYSPDIDSTNSITIDQLLERQKHGFKQNKDNKTQMSFYIPPFAIKGIEGQGTVGGSDRPVKSPLLSTVTGSPPAQPEHGNLLLLVHGSPNVAYTFDVIFEATVVCYNPQ